MGQIRVVGRSRGGRCVFCHDSLQGDVRRCPECGAAWHPDCGAASTRARCPTIGCGGPAPDAEERRGRQRRPAAAPQADWTTITPDRPRRRPGLAARLGPYVRLAVSGLLTTLLLMGALAFLLFPLVDPSGFWRSMSTGKGGSHTPWPFALMQTIALVAVACGAVWVAASWLVRLPSVWRELGQLLDDTTPTAMRLGIYSTGSGKSRKRWATLSPLSGPRSGPLTILLDGVLPPWWLNNQDGARVLVYGLPPPGPYILEFEDGWLALVHPDD